MIDLPLGNSADGSDDGRDGGERGDRADGREGDADDGHDSDRFDPADAFVPASLPEPGPFLCADDAEVVTGDDHVTVRDTARELFDERGVRDATFGYVLTKLDRDRNHPEAGFRYARASVEGADVLRVEFTPTTGFCPQGGALATAAFRAWNAEPERHGYDRVAVRVSPTYHASDAVNDRLADAEATLRETGTLPSIDGENDAPASGSERDRGVVDP